MNKWIQILLVSSVNLCNAQDSDLASINYAISKLHYNDTAANTKLLDMKFLIPLFQKKKHTIMMVVNYKNMSLSSFPVNFENTLQGLAFQAIWQTKFTDNKNLTVFSQVGLFSDIKDISGKDFRYGIGFRYRIKHSDKLSTGWGLVYARQFFGNQVLPFIDIDYKPNNTWSITGQFPVKPKMLYHFNKKLSTGIEISGDAASYRLSQQEKNNQFIQINQWTGLAKLEYHFAKAWHLNCGIGRNFKQSYKLYNNGAMTAWTIFTLPIGSKPEPVQNIENSGLNMQIGVSFTPFTTR